MRKRLLLVNPGNPRFLRLGLRAEGRLPPLALGIIAALTPQNWDVKIIDENFESFKFSDADLVGITSFTHNAPRAYEISEIFRKKGITTVMGGIHASMVTKEALQYVDVVVIGEVENVWGKVIADFEAGTLKRRYRGGFEELTNMPLPRYDLLHPSYIGAIQTTRGCPMNCSFCSVTAFNGNRYRHRPIEEVLDELGRIPKKFVFFVDDNLVGYGKKNEERAIELFKGIIDRGIEKLWACQVSMNIADNEDILKYAAKSGCRLVSIGVEAETTDALKELNKNINIKKSYEQVFRRIHKYGIAIHGFFMYGLDVDTPETLQRRTDYIMKCDVDSVAISIVCPFPGTKLYDKMAENNRIMYTQYPDDWAHYHFLGVVHKPKLIEIQVLKDMATDGYRRIYSRRALWMRFFKTLYITRNLISAVVALRDNKRLRDHLKQLIN